MTISISFKKFVEKYGFVQQKEERDGQMYLVEYASSLFVIELETYRREVYASLRKTGIEDSWINLFNLLAYLGQSSTDVPKSNYYSEEKNVDERYCKQVEYITRVIEENILAIIEFFGAKDYPSKYADVEAFVIKRNPELFKKLPGNDTGK